MFFDQLINSLTLGSTYALIALGYTMVYGILQLINFAHGEIYMIGAFIGLIMVSYFHLPFYVALIIAMAGSAILGVCVEKIAYKPLRESPRLALLISAIGMSIFLQNSALIIAGPAARPFSQNINYGSFTIGGMHISTLQITIIAVSVIMMIGLHFFIMKTKMGKAMRATSYDQAAARLMGIDIDNVISATFALGSALGAAAGVLIGLYFNSVDPTMGAMPGLKGFIAAVVGGIGNIPGAMLGGLLLGAAEVFGTIYISSYKDAIAFTLLIAILLLKPSGLMGSTLREKV
ncbi:branched-chain amino acid ABC transporter permease [Calorimonas adulescens]|jgi:amino acid/amide ABC transporter membrane protein 1, HAAT family (TC 3.A.1.4.-)|uniref:Branched-chain amino acid ABC transporter permease n=1 Tax=Calorimonas adulescens TaxID=2606906 RepID=A0A5D8QHS8_9THEO|nr:branched-chain amino acid ABC transporter permease [Calorimonas adulescens]TZE83123.1 branched-chain amino acid ABC transporter permease [Calorimonas adulescens]